MSSSKSNHSKLSVVIVNYNVCDYVLEAITSLKRFVSNPLEIIVVDNNSTDDSVMKIESHHPEVMVIRNTMNKGFSAANNQGFERASGEFILMFNPDAVLINDSFTKMIEELQSRQEQSILIGPALINSDNSFQTSCWKFPHPFQHLLELFFLNTVIDTTKYSEAHLSEMNQVDFISGACILMSRHTCKQLNGLDENLFWMDDADLCKRNQNSGGKTIYFPETVVKHHIGKSSQKNQKVVISNQIKSKLKFYWKHKQYMSYFFSIPILYLQVLSRIPIFFLLGIIKPLYIQKAKAYTYTLFEFFSR